MGKAWTELVSQDDAIPLVRDWVASAKVPVAILEPVEDGGRKVLEALQVTTRSPLGAVAFHTGGLLVDHGWLRVLGSGSPPLPRALGAWNGLGATPRCAEGLLIADDALGGFFCWFNSPRTVHYLAPDTLRWGDTGLGYSDWLAWCFTERLASFYRELRWDGWEPEVEALPGGRALHVAPPLFTRGPPIGERSRRAVPLEEHWALAVDMRARLEDVEDGEVIKLVRQG